MNKPTHMLIPFKINLKDSLVIPSQSMKFYKYGDYYYPNGLKELIPSLNKEVLLQKTEGHATFEIKILQTLKVYFVPRVVALKVINSYKAEEQICRNNNFRSINEIESDLKALKNNYRKSCVTINVSNIQDADKTFSPLKPLKNYNYQRSRSVRINDTNMSSMKIRKSIHTTTNKDFQKANTQTSGMKGFLHKYYKVIFWFYKQNLG